MINTAKLLVIVIEAGAFISTMAAFVASIIMFRVTRKFGTGILASGFKSISIGVLFIALGLMVDAVQSYLQVESFTEIQQFITIILIIKLVLYVIGTYVIVIGSKRIGDNFQSLTK
jgi:hypothetical protein